MLHKLFSFMKKFSLFALFLLLCNGGLLKAEEEIIAPGSIIRPEDTSKPAYTPGFGWGGIPMNDSQFYEIPPEKCEGTSTAQILQEYYLTDKLFLFKTDKGYGVMELNQTLKELETGARRRKNCPIGIGIKINGEIDCRGIRTVKQEPYEGCAYEGKIWTHSLSESQAFNFIYTKLQSQFKEYKQKCVLPPKPRTLEERMIKF